MAPASIAVNWRSRYSLMETASKIPITLNGEGVTDEQYAEVCQHLQRTVRTALVEGRREISTLLDQCVGIGHYATGGLARKDWKAISQTLSVESMDHVEHFFSLKLEAAIREGMSWAVLRFDVLPTYADVVGSQIREKVGLQNLRRTRSERRRARLEAVTDYGTIAAAVARMVRDLGGLL